MNVSLTGHTEAGIKDWSGREAESDLGHGEFEVFAEVEGLGRERHDRLQEGFPVDDDPEKATDEEIKPVAASEVTRVPAAHLS